MNKKGFMTTICGTPEYVAPEVLNKLHKKTVNNNHPNKEESDGYGIEVDMWSAGVCLYILLSGCQAFEQAPGQDKETFYNLVRSGSFQFTPVSRWLQVSAQAKDLIKKLIEVNPKKRLNVDQALAHPWIVSNDSSKQQDIPLNFQNDLVKTLSARKASLSLKEQDADPNHLSNESSHNNDSVFNHPSLPNSPNKCQSAAGVDLPPVPNFDVFREKEKAKENLVNEKSLFSPMEHDSPTEIEESSHGKKRKICEERDDTEQPLSKRVKQIPDLNKIIIFVSVSVA